MKQRKMMRLGKGNDLPWQLQQQHSGELPYDNQVPLAIHHQNLDRLFWLPQSPDALCLYRLARLPPNSPPISTAKNSGLKSLKHNKVAQSTSGY